MAETILNTRIQLRKDTAANWDLFNPVLASAELGVNTDNGKMKLGDGTHTWSELPYLSNENDVAPFTHFEGASIEEAIGEATPQEGDICVVKTPIAGGKESMTSYVYDAGEWKAMDGNYSAANVYFTSDMVITTPVGIYTQKMIDDNNGSIVHSTQGKSVVEGLSTLFAEVKAPTITDPVVSLSASATPGSAEIGTKITKLNWNGSFTSGSYEYGSKIGDTKYTDTGTGITAATWSISNNITDQVSTLEDGNFALPEDKYIQIDSTSSKTYATITWSGTYGDSPRTPVNNVGTEVEGRLLGKTITGTANVNATGYRNSFYYVGSDYTTTIDSAFVRAATGRGSNTKNFNVNTYAKDGKTKCLTIPGGTKRIMLAVPGAATLSEVKDLDGMGLDVKGNFTKTTVDVQGANGFTATSYTIFDCVNSEGIAATNYVITIA